MKPCGLPRTASPLRHGATTRGRQKMAVQAKYMTSHSVVEGTTVPSPRKTRRPAGERGESPRSTSKSHSHQRPKRSSSAQPKKRPPPLSSACLLIKHPKLPAPAFLPCRPAHPPASRRRARVRSSRRAPQRTPQARRSITRSFPQELLLLVSVRRALLPSRSSASSSAVGGRPPASLGPWPAWRCGPAAMAAAAQRARNQRLPPEVNR